MSVNWLGFIIGLVAVVGAFLLKEGLSGLLARMDRAGWKLQQDLTDALRIGIQGAWDQLVHKLKADAADGKLSDAQKQEARDLAKKLAMDVAKGPVLKALQALAPKALDAIISLLVQRQKRTKE